MYPSFLCHWAYNEMRFPLIYHMKVCISSSPLNDILLPEFQCHCYSGTELSTLDASFWRTVVQKHLIRSPQHNSQSGRMETRSSGEPFPLEDGKGSSSPIYQQQLSSLLIRIPCQDVLTLRISSQLAQEASSMFPSGNGLTRRYTPTWGDTTSRDMRSPLPTETPLPPLKSLSLEA